MSRNMTRREALAALCMAGAAGLAGCGRKEAAQPSEDVLVRVAALKGPTAIGLLNMMKETGGIPADGGDLAKAEPSGTGISYAYQISAAPDEIVPLAIQGTADIALVPSNVSAILWNKTGGAVQAIDINTLGVLYVVTGDSSVQDFTDLAGKSVYISGKGASPQYATEYLLHAAGIADAVTLEWKSAHDEVASYLASDPSAIGILPQPFVTALLMQHPELGAPISLTDVWDRYAGGSGSRFVMGTTIVRKEFADAHPAAVSDFLARHAASVAACGTDVPETAGLAVEAGILPKEQIAEKAIPKCSVVCIQGQEMEDALKGYLQVLADADEASVGGALPDDAFYRKG